MSQEIKDYLLELTEQPDLRFKGFLVGRSRVDASAQTKDDGAIQEYSVYLTVGGTYICVKTLMDQAGVLLKANGRKAKNGLDFIDFFGLGKAAKQLYRNLGVDIGFEEFVD